MGTNQPLPLGSVLVIIILCAQCFSNAEHPELESKDIFISRINQIIQENNASYPQCNIFNARMCFMQMANVTMEAVMMRRQEDHCKMAGGAAACIEYSMSGCPKEVIWPGLRVLYPFVDLLKSIKSVVCSERFRTSEEDDDENCHMETVAGCITGFAYVAADTSMAITCRQAKQTHRCLTIATQQCESRQINNMVSMTTAVLSQMAREACPTPGCNIPIANECMNGAKYILASPIASVQKSHVLCGSLMDMNECISSNTMDCPLGAYEEMGNFMIHLNSVVMETCANMSDIMPMTDPYIGQIASFYAVANSPFASRESVCPFYQSAVMKLLSMIKMGDGDAMDHWYTMSMISHASGGLCDHDEMCEDMDMGRMAELKCDVQMAEQCVKDTDLMSLMSNVDILGWDVVCHSGLRMVECVHKSMSGCGMEESGKTNATLHRVLGMVANHCPIEPVLAKVSCLLPRCDASAALEKCFQMPNETTLAMGMAPQLVNETLRCIGMHTRGCAMSPSFLPLAYSTRKYLDMMKPYVYSMDLMQEDKMDNKAMKDISECTFKFMGGFELAMTNSNNFSEAMCYLFSGMDKECGKMSDDIPSALRPGMKMQEMVMTEMMKAQCSTMKNKPGRCPNTTRDGAAHCANMCSSDDMCPKHQKCCSNGCGHVCMDAVIDEESMKHLQSKTQEPASCKMYEVATYFSTYWLRLMQMTFTPVKEKANICKSKHWYYDFGLTNMATCSPERQAIFMESWKMIEAVHDHVCPVAMPMIMMSEDKDKCKLEAAAQCHDDFLQVLLISPAYHSKDTCMKLLYTFNCMEEAVGDCTENSTVMMEVRKKIPFLKAMIGNECRDHFYGERFCKHRDSPTIKAFNNMECNKSMAQYCIEEFDKAKPMLSNTPEALCRGAMAAKMCVMAKTNNCSMTEAIWNGQNKTEIADSFKTFCPNMDKMKDEDDDDDDSDEDKSMEEDDDDDDSDDSMENDDDDDEDEEEEDEKCHLLEPVPECITTVSACFGNATDICGNAVAIKACLNLAMVGCDSMMLTSVLDGLQMDDYLTSLPCDFLPDFRPEGYQKPNVTFPSDCMVNVTEAREYFKDPIMRDERAMMCEMLPARAQCLENKTKDLPMVARFIAHKIASALRQAVFIRCETTEHVLDNKEMMLNDTATGYCDLDLAASCIMTSTDYNFFGIGAPLGDKKSMCRSRIDAFQCLQSVASGCSEVAKARLLYHVEVTSSMMRMLGVCAEDNMYRCDPQGAMDCISKLGSGHVLATGTPMEQAICGAIGPVEKCVVEKSAACMPKVRMSIEKSLVQVSAMARSVCSEKSEMEEKEMKGMCKLDKASRCMNALLNKTSMLLQGHGERKRVCGEIIELSVCANMYSMNCRGEEAKMIEANKPLVEMLVKATCSRDMEKPSPEMKGCEMVAGSCLTQYLWLAMSSYTAMCSQAVPTLACLRSATEICPIPAKLAVSAAAKHLATISMEMCGSKGCNPRMAYGCLEDSHKYIQAAGSRMLDSPMVCGAIMPSLVCAVNHTIHCNHDDDPDLHKAIYALKVMVQDVCPKVQVNPVLGYLENVTAVEVILPVSMIFLSPMVSKEMLCPQVKMAMDRFSEMMTYMTPPQLAKASVNSYMMKKIAGTFCDKEDMMRKQMEVDMTRTQYCNITMVMQCVREADIAGRLSTAVFYGMLQVCDAVEKVMCCLNQLTSGCTDYRDILTSLQLGSDVASMVADQCPIQRILTDTMQKCTPPPEMCYTHKALEECYVPLKTRNDVNVLCQNLTAVDMCFHMYLKGCMSIQAAPHANILKSYHALCNSNPTASLIRDDQVIGATKCAMTTMSNLQTSFQKTNNPFKVICSEIDKSDKCHMGAGDLPPMFWYMAAAGNKTMTEFKEKFCDDLGPDGVSVAEPYSCMEEVAAMCASSYLSRIATWRFIPIADREGACMEIIEVAQCVKNALTSCSTSKQQMYREVMETIYFMHDRACPSLPYQHLLMYQDHVCYEDTASMCVEGFGKYLAVSSGRNKVEACKHFGQMMQCVHYSTKNCTQTTAQHDKMVAMVNVAKSIMGNTCPLLSAVSCDPANLRAIVGYAGCNHTAANRCLMDFGRELENIKENDTLMCSAYKKANDCAMIHTMMCENDSPQMEALNHTLYVGMATYGERCVERIGMTEEMKCWMRKPCSVWVDPCFPEDPEETCRNVSKVEECLRNQEVECGETFKLQRQEAIRQLLKTRNASCDVMSLMSTTPKYSPNMIGECYMMLQNLTGQYFMMENPTDMDIYNGLKTFSECVKQKSDALPDLWRGIWKQTMAQAQQVTKTQAKFLEVITKKIMEDAMNNKTDNPFLSDMKDDDKEDDAPNSQMRDDSRNYTEAEDCKPKEASRCMMDYIAMTTFVGYLPFQDRQGTCWLKKNMLIPCINKHTKSCSPRVQGKFIKMFVVTRRIENALGMCSDHDNNMSDMEKEDRPMSKMSCKPMEAAKCMSMLSGALIGSVGKQTYTVICSSIMPVYRCVIEHTWDCEHKQRQAIENVWQDLYAVSMEMCRMGEYKMPEPVKCDAMNPKIKYKCDLPQALSCITTMHAELMKGEDSICSGVPSFRSCVYKSLSGCERTQVEAMEVMVAGLHRRVAQRCPRVQCDLCAARICMAKMPKDTKNMTCIDTWKVKECVMKQVVSCSEEETQHINREMMEKLRNVSEVCKEKNALDMCALDFKDTVKKLFKLDIMLDWGIEDYNMMMQRNDSSMPDNKPDGTPMSNDKMSNVSMETIIKHLLAKNSQCPDLLKGDKKEALCKRAALSWQCVEMFVQTLPGPVRDVALETMKMIGMAVDKVCYEKDLTCYSCRGAKSDEECNMMPQQHCNRESHVCYTIVENGRISKGCAPDIPYTRNQQCVRNGTKCLYKCHMDDCNMMKHKPIQDPPTCNRKAAMKCGVYMIHSMVSSEMPDCSALMSGLMCIHDNTKDCISHTDGEVSKMAANTFLTPLMMKCQAEPHHCGCGRCASVALGRVIDNPGSNVKDICRMAEHTQMKVLEAVLVDQCTMADLKDLRGSVHFAKTLLGDACDSQIAKMNHVNYNEGCNEEKAMMCFKAANISWMMDQRERLGRPMICRTVYKMMGCARVSMEKCDASVSANQLNMTAHHIIDKVKDMCNMSIIKDFMSPGMDAKRDERMFKAIGDELEILEAKIKVIHDVTSTGVRGETAVCKPSIALNNCFSDLFLTPGSDANFCNIAKKAWDCQMLLISQCTPLQMVPVMQVFYSLVAKDTEFCGYPTKPSDEQLRMLSRTPYYNLSRCVGEYIEAQAHAWVTPSQENLEKDCMYAVKMDNCVHQEVDFSPMAKIARAHMARMTGQIKRAACSVMTLNMTMEKCGNDDVLCQLMRNMSMVRPSAASSASDPPTCNKSLAGFCLTSYVSRLLVWAFSPIEDQEYTCRDFKNVKECVALATPTCSEPTKQMFQMGVSWLDFMVTPVCTMKFDLSQPSCKMAGQCLEMFGRYSRQPNLEQGEFCRKLDGTLECLEQHLFNCSAGEMTYFRKMMYLLGNATDDWCPEQTQYTCALSQLEPRNITQSCDDTAGIGSCIDTYYQKTFEMVDTDPNYCNELMTVTKCFVDKSKNCHPHKIEELYQIMYPGLRSKNVTCPDVQAYLATVMTPCPVKKCNIPYLLYGVHDVVTNFTKMREEKKTLNEVCSYVAGVMTEHAKMMEGCNSLEMYLIKFVLNKATNDYLMSCPANIYQATTPTPNDEVAPVTKCFSDLSNNMESAIKSPKYGFLDICEVASTMTHCMGTAFINAGREPAIDWVIGQLNETHHAITEFVKKECKANISMLMQISQASSEPADCMQDTAMNCIQMMTVKAIAPRILSHGNEDMCRYVRSSHQCLERSAMTCSPIFRSQLRTMFVLNLALIGDLGDRCELNLAEITPKDQAREMYMKLAMFMTSTSAKENRMITEMTDRMKAGLIGADDEMDREMDDDDENDDDMENMDRDDEEDSDDMDRDDENDRMGGDNKMEGDMKCNLYRVNQCMMKIVSNFQMYASRICREDSTYLMDCVRPNLSPCDNSTQRMMYFSMFNMEGLLRKSCASYMWMVQYLGQGDKGKEMDDSKAPQRNAFEMGQGQSPEEMKTKMMEEVKVIFGQVNKIHQVLKFVRNAENPLDLKSADSMEVIEMFKEMHKMSDNMKDCVEKDSLEGQGYCHPSVALECSQAVEQELMSPWATKNRICMKYALAVRCGMLTSQGCDFFTSHHLHSRFREVMGYVGDMCPTVLKDECEEETKCKVKEVESCLMPLHSKIMASLQLPTSSTGNLCQYLQLAGECIREKVEHCPEKVWYMLHNFLQPGLGPLARMCQKLPPQAMFTTLIWNMGSILTLDANMHKLGSMYTMIKMAEKHGKTMDMSPWMRPIVNVNVSDSYLTTVKNFHKMVAMSEKKCSLKELMGKAENMEMDDEMDERRNSTDGMDSQMDGMSDMPMTGDSVMIDLLHMVKYVMMNDGLVEKDEQFIKMVRIAMLNLNNDPSMKDMMDVSSHIMKELKEKLGEQQMKKMNVSVNMVMNDVMKIIVAMGDGHDIVTSAYHTLAYMKIGEMMDKINEFLMEERDSEEYFNRWDYLNRGLVESMKEKIKKDLTMAAMGYLKLHMEPNNTETLEHLMQVMAVKKLTTCASMVEVQQTAMAYLPMLPDGKRALMNMTLQGLSHVASALCMGQKCYACDGEKDNMECNKQTTEQCRPGQGCFTLIRNHTMITKGCMYPLYGQTFGEDWKFCSGNMCNKYKWTVEEEKDKDCKPMAALMCLANMVPVIAADGKLDERLINYNLGCIEKHTSTCMMSDARKMADLVPMIRHGLYESQCSAEMNEYECGTRSIVGLTLTAMNPSADRMAFCSQLNDTFRSLEWAEKHKKCSDYERLAAYKGIKSIMQIVGDGYCPMVMPKREVFCQNMTGTVCNQTAALQCFNRYMVMDKFKRGMSMEENNVFCWTMTELMMCIGNETLGCKPTDNLSQFYVMYQEKVGQLVSHCPHLQMHQDICYPEVNTPTQCHPNRVYTQCMQPIMDKGCGVIDDNSTRETLMKCYMELTSGCSYIQVLRVWNSMDLSLVEYIMSCNDQNITSMLLDRRADRLDHYFARGVALVTARSMMIDMPEPTRDSPITAMLHRIVMMRMNATGVLQSLTNVSSNGYRKVRMFLQAVADNRAKRQDDTHKLARCAVQFDTSFTIALALPAMFEGLYCETLNSFEQCLSEASDGQLVPSVYARGMRDQYAGYRDLMCKDYPDRVVNISSVVMKAIGFNENTTADKTAELSNEKWNQLLDHIQKKDDVCDTWYIAAMISNAATAIVLGPFKSPESYAVMCLIIRNLRETVKTKIDECSAEKRQKYYDIIQVMERENYICYDKAINLTKPSTCQVEKAGECIANALNFLSSKSLPDHQLCMHLSQAVTCVYHNIEHCSVAEQQYMTSMLHYLQTIMGNRCPLLTALSQCPDPSASAGAKCDAMAVKTCAESFTPSSQCSDIIAVSDCVAKNSYNCSSYELHWINGFMKLWWKNALKRCPEKDLVETVYSTRSCSRPPSCNLGEAYSCAAKYTSTDCSHLNNVKVCFEQHTRGCNSMTFMLGKATFDLYQRSMHPSCSASANVTLTLPTYAGNSTSFNKMYKCMDTYINMSSDLSSSCKNYFDFLECLGRNVTEQESAWGMILAGPAFKQMAELMKRVCSVPLEDFTSMVDNSGNQAAANVTCDVSMGSQCLAMAGLNTMFSSVMTIEDKKTFCNRSATSMINCVAPIGKCLRTNAALRSAHNVIDHVKMFSGVCPDETWICAPEDAMYCGRDMLEKMQEMEMMANSSSAGRNMTMGMITEREQKAFCGMYEESMKCVHQLTFACSPEVGQYVKQSVMTSLCLTFDFAKHCPSIMKTTSVDIPKCFEKDMEDKEMTDKGDKKTDMVSDSMGCSQAAIEECVSELYYELYGAFLDCSRFHRTYVKTMNCIHDNSKNCTKRDPAVLPLAVALSNYTVQQVYMRCPNVVMMPCREPDPCGIEKAHECYWRFTEFNKTTSDRLDMCLAADITKTCNMEHTKHCSIFGQHSIPTMIDQDLFSRGMACNRDPEQCLHRFYMASVNMIRRDLIMASLMKQREAMTFTIGDGVNSNYISNMMIANATRMAAMGNEMMAKAFYNYSMIQPFLPNKTVSLIKMVEENLMVYANSEDNMVVYTKLKMSHCAAVYEDWQCLMTKRVESGVSTEAFEGLRSTLGKFFQGVDSMCREASVMYLVEQPESCQMLPAVVAYLNHIKHLAEPTVGVIFFCLNDDLTSTIDKMTDYTRSCTGKVQEQFTDAIISLKEARDYLCTVRPSCQAAKAQECIQNLKNNMNCSTYDLTHACVETSLQSCDAVTSIPIKKELKTLYSSLSCETLPSIKVVPSLVRLLEGDNPTSLNISVEQDSTLWCLPDETCEIKFKIDVESGNEKCADGTAIPQIAIGGAAGGCQRTITSQNWDQSVSYSLNARIDSRYDNTHNIPINVTAMKYVDGNLNLTRVVAQVQAVVVNTDQSAMCVTMGTNKMSTFDGLYQSVQFEGEFVVYRQKRFTQQEVHTLYQRCTPSGSKVCLCAVMVKVGDNSLTVDKCRRAGQANGPAVPNVAFYKSGSLAEGLHFFLDNGGREMKVLLPTGTVVGVDMMNLRLWILPSPLDWLSTEGLCGSYDANKMNDAVTRDGTRLNLVNNAVPQQLALSWRVLAFESLFGGVINVAGQASQAWSSYCSCQAGSTNNQCQTMAIVETCDLVSGTDITATFQQFGETAAAGRRKKRATTDPLSDLGLDYTYEVPVSSWQGAWTETTARQECESQITNSDLGQKCIQATGYDFEAEVLACIDSIRDNGNKDSIGPIIESMKEKCLAELDKNLQTSDPTIITEILKLSCPNDCSGHGTCTTDGTCTCNSGYMSSDCSVPVGVQPTLASLRDGDVCELSLANTCNSVIVLGQNFMDTNQLSCYYEFRGQVVKGTARYITGMMVECSALPSVPTKDTIKVYVTNNGAPGVNSPSLSYTVYHPGCYSCTDYQTCQILNTGCVIGGTCYHGIERNPGDQCQRCIPEISTTAWTHVIGGNCVGYLSTAAPPTTQAPSGGSTQSPNTGNDNTTTEKEEEDRVILIVLGALTAGFALISILLACKLCVNKESEIKRQSQDYSPSASDSASNREYDNVRAFDNLGYSYSTAQPYQKPASVEDLSPPTEIKVEEKSYL